MGLFSKKKGQPKQPLDKPPPFGELVAPEPPPQDLMNTSKKEFENLPPLSQLPDDLSLPSLEEDFKPLKAEAFGLPTLGEEKFPEQEYKLMTGPLFPEIPKEPLEPVPLPRITKPTVNLLREPLKPIQREREIQEHEIIAAESGFINLNDYSQARAWVEDINQNADIGEDTVYRLNELDQEADKYYQKFVAYLEFLQRKMVIMDKILFKG